MIDGTAFLLFLSGALLLNITPGPDMAFTLATTARCGARAGMSAAIGVGAGSLIWAAATAAGLSAFLAASDNAMSIIRLIGGVYLLVLAVRTVTDDRPANKVRAGAEAANAFRTGVVTNLFNPKVGLFFLAFLPSFVSAQSAAPALQMFFLGAVFSVTGAIVLVLVALGAGRLRARFAGSDRFRGWLKGLSASMFGGLGCYLLLSQER